MQSVLWIRIYKRKDFVLDNKILSCCSSPYFLKLTSYPKSFKSFFRQALKKLHMLKIYLALLRQFSLLQLFFSCHSRISYLTSDFVPSFLSDISCSRILSNLSSFNFFRKDYQTGQLKEISKGYLRSYAQFSFNRTWLLHYGLFCSCSYQIIPILCWFSK